MYQKIIWVSLFLLLILGLLTFFNLYWRWQAINTTAAATMVVDKESLLTGMAKVRQWERFVEANPPRPNRLFTAEFSVLELQAIIRDVEINKSSPSFFPATIEVKIDSEKIFIQGIAAKPLAYPLAAVITAAVKDGRLVTEVISAHVSIWRVSPKLIDKLAVELFGHSWTAEINRPSFLWDELIFSEDKIYVSGHTTGQLYK